MCVCQIHQYDFWNWKYDIDLDPFSGEYMCIEIEFTDDGEPVKNKQKTKTGKSEKNTKSKT